MQHQPVLARTIVHKAADIVIQRGILLQIPQQRYSRVSRAVNQSPRALSERPRLRPLGHQPDAYADASRNADAEQKVDCEDRPGTPALIATKHDGRDGSSRPHY